MVAHRDLTVFHMEGSKCSIIGHTVKKNGKRKEKGTVSPLCSVHSASGG